MCYLIKLFKERFIMSLRPRVADPTELIWPVVDIDKEKSVLGSLESVFSKYKSCMRTIKKPPKWKKQKGDGDKEDRLSEEELKQKKEFKSMFVVGVQTVMKNLEKDKLSAVLLWRGIQPAVLRRALLHLLHEHGCLAICVSDLLSPIQKSWPGLTSVSCLGVLKTEKPNDFYELIETVSKNAPPLTNLKDDKKDVKPLAETKAKSDTAVNTLVNKIENAVKNKEAETKTDIFNPKVDSKNDTGSKTSVPTVVDPTKYFILSSKSKSAKSFSGQSFIAFDEGNASNVKIIETVKGVRVKAESRDISSKDQNNFDIRPSLIKFNKDKMVDGGNSTGSSNSDRRKEDPISGNRKRKADDNDVNTNSEYKMINVKKLQKNMQKNKQKKKNKRNKIK